MRTILGYWSELKTALQDITTSTWAVIIKQGFYDFFIPRNLLNSIYYLSTKVKQSRVSIKITHASPINGKCGIINSSHVNTSLQWTFLIAETSLYLAIFWSKVWKENLCVALRPNTGLFSSVFAHIWTEL